MTRPHDPTRLLSRYREAIEPTSDQLDAVWRDLADPDAALRVVEPRHRPAPPRRAGRAAVGGALVALAAAAALAWWLGSTVRPVTTVGDTTAVQASHDRRPGRADGVARARGGAAPVARPGAAESPPATSPADDAPAVAAPAGSSRPGPSPRPGSRTTPADTLVQETALVQRAEALLREDQPASALAVLDEHARDYPRGVLAVERKALRAIALCEQGVVAQGRGEAELLLRAEASRPYRERIRRACGIE